MFFPSHMHSFISKGRCTYPLKKVFANMHTCYCFNGPLVSKSFSIQLLSEAWFCSTYFVDICCLLKEMVAPNCNALSGFVANLRAVYQAHENTGMVKCTPGSAFIKPDQRNPWIKDQIKITLLPTISHLLLPNFVSCGRACPSHMTQNLVTVGAKLWTADRFIVDPWSMDYADPVW